MALGIILIVIFGILQGYCFWETWKYRSMFENFFKIEKGEGYVISVESFPKGKFPQLEEVGKDKSDLNKLIGEINHYIVKTKGTTDFSVIQNKVERKLNMRYEQSIAKLSFPTYLGLMGTFLGVFIGILMFNSGFDTAEGISDSSIKNLLSGVLVSMFTSLVGLVLTTINNALSSESKKTIEEEKNLFYDFIQTELMPQVDASMSAALSRLHKTVDKFEPAFNSVITKFQDTFDRCTSAFGSSFEKNVMAVTSAVVTMGKNMALINKNIQHQEDLLNTLKSKEFAHGLDRYIEASNHFVGITKSLNKFEEARRMMLAAAQEAINIQNEYSDQLRIPREVAVNINKILDRVQTFEQSINELGSALVERDVLGADVAKVLKEQVDTIKRRHQLVEDHRQIADEKIGDLFEEQTAVIDQLNTKYTDAISRHIGGFEEMLKDQSQQLEAVYNHFKKALQDKFTVDDLQKEFTNLRKLNDILQEMKSLSENSVKQKVLRADLQNIQAEVGKITLRRAPGPKPPAPGEKKKGGLFGIFRKKKNKKE